MEKNNYCKQDGAGQLTVVELDNNFNYTRMASKAEAALMHPSQNIIALKAKTEGVDKYIVQVTYNIQTSLGNYLTTPRYLKEQRKKD